jgi:hypothetical protein
MAKAPGRFGHLRSSPTLSHQGIEWKLRATATSSTLLAATLTSSERHAQPRRPPRRCKVHWSTMFAAWPHRSPIMKSTLFVRTSLLCGFMLAAVGTLSAQDFGTLPPPQETQTTESYTSAPYAQPAQPSYETHVRTVSQQNAYARGQQRQQRMASMAWYGMSNSRPTVSTTPFTTIYSPVWQMPGGRPFAWNYSSWPATYVIYR